MLWDSLDQRYNSGTRQSARFLIPPPISSSHFHPILAQETRPLNASHLPTSALWSLESRLLILGQLQLDLLLFSASKNVLSTTFPRLYPYLSDETVIIQTRLTYCIFDLPST